MGARTPHLPSLILMTDAERLPDPRAAVHALPERSAVIVRHGEDAARRELAGAIMPIARDCGVRVLIANDATLADEVRADGLHLSELRAADAARWRAERPRWLITAAAHSEAAVAAAAQAQADAALLSPVFVTPSHPCRAPVGVQRFLEIARNAAIPVYALGGVNAANVELLVGRNVAGIAAIKALS